MTYSFNPPDIQHRITFRFHGRDYKAYCTDQLFHPATWTHLDETDVRDDWWQVERGQHVLDIGADFGSYTLTALACGAERVFAWSPPFKLPDEAVEAYIMQQSVQLNGWSDRAVILSSGLYESTGWLAAFDGPRNAQFFLTRDEALRAIEGQDGHVATFPVVPLDSLGLMKVDWMKVDTEGCEEPILRGAEQTIRRCRPRVILEHHFHLDEDCKFTCDMLLEQWGYEPQPMRGHGQVAHTLYLP